MAREVFRYFIVCPRGTETFAAEDIRAAGGTDIEIGQASLKYRGTVRSAYWLCLNSRVIQRVLMPIKNFEAHTPEHLYEGVRRVNWSKHMRVDQTLAVNFTTVRSAIAHTQYGALKVKDAVVDQFRDATGERPNVSKLEPDLRIHVHVERNEAEVSLDLSGESLHRRGYRMDGAQAPMKETLAAGVLLHIDLPKITAEGGAFFDPMCGSGTLAIEAGLIAIQKAPGLLRKHFGFLGWGYHDANAWAEVKAEAEARVIRDPHALKRLAPIIGTDQDGNVTRAAIGNVEAAGLRGVVHIEKRELMSVEAPAGFAKGAFVVNPPYGERLGDVKDLEPLYKNLGDLMKQKFHGWQGAILTGSPELSKCIGLKTRARIPLWNGPIECRLLRYDLY